MWHPVGPLPPAVYWRRRIGVLLALLALLAGLVGLGYALATGRLGGDPAEASSAGSASSAVPAPALERVVPALTTPRAPTPPPAEAAEVARSSSPVTTACTDALLGLTARAPAVVAVGGKASFELVVQNASLVPCGRSLDGRGQEVVLLDGRGPRLWGATTAVRQPAPLPWPRDRSSASMSLPGAA